MNAEWVIQGEQSEADTTSTILDIESLKSLEIGCCFMLNNNSDMCVILKCQSQTFSANQSILFVQLIFPYIPLWTFHVLFWNWLWPLVEFWPGATPVWPTMQVLTVIAVSRGRDHPPCTGEGPKAQTGPVQHDKAAWPCARADAGSKLCLLWLWDFKGVI